MKPKLTSKIIAMHTKEFQALGFELVSAPDSHYRKCERVFLKQIDSLGSLCVIQNPHHSRFGLFTLEVGWSKLGRIPELKIRPQTFELQNPKLLDFEEYVCRLPGLVTDLD
jgi:hypothetical protein